MLVIVDDVLNRDEVHEARRLLAASSWEDGTATAGTQAAQVKRNRQVPEASPQLPALRRLVLEGIGRSALFFSAALPARILPPFFNRYGGDGERYGPHVDGAIRAAPDGGRVRADVSATLFLADPDDYDGGELVIEDTFGRHGVKLPAGSLVLYPSSSVHEVTPVTRGERLASFMFVQSLVRDAGRRRMLHELDLSLLALRGELGETPPIVRLTGLYHNLLRDWAEA